MRKLLGALLSLAVSFSPAAGGEVVRAIEKVAFEPSVVNLRVFDLPATLVAPPLLTDAPALTALPDLAVVLNGAAANDQQIPRQDAPAGELEAQAQAVKFDGVKAPQWRSMALAIMAAGSFNLSRTNMVGRKWFAPAQMTNQEVQAKAETNFRKAAGFVVDRAAELPLNRATAILLNKILTEGLVPEDIRGDPDYHRDTRVFYEWLEGPEAARLAAADPVEFAQQLHYKMSRVDSFPDGNGRLARLMADLALVKAGMAPVYYSDMKDYFERGNHRSKVSPEGRRGYFREMVQRGQEAMKDPSALKAVSGIDPQTLRAITDNEGHSGKPAISRKIERAALAAKP